MGRMIRNFNDARASDLANERMPQFDYTARPSIPLVPVPSMRLPNLALATSPGGVGPAGDGAPGGSGAGGELGDGNSRRIEDLIKRALEEEGLGDGGMVERLADKIARGSRVARPRNLKRFETAP